MARRITGNGFVIVDRSADVERSARNAIERAIARGTIAVQAETKRLLNLKSGPTKKNPHFPPSLPGEPPARRTGHLGQSIESETVQRGGGEFVGRVGTGKRYGFWLELGTRRMAARPFLRPALASQHRRIVSEVVKAGKEIK